MSAVAAHEARHVAASLTLGLPVTHASVSGHEGETRHGGVEVDPVNARSLTMMALSGGLHDHGCDNPTWPPRSNTKDERVVKALVEHCNITQSEYWQLVNDTLRMTNTKSFMEVEDHVAQLLDARGHLDATDLRSLKTWAMSKGMEEYDEAVAGERDEDGVIADSALDYSLAYSQHIEEAQPTHSQNGTEPEDFERIKDAARDMILALG